MEKEFEVIFKDWEEAGLRKDETELNSDANIVIYNNKHSGKYCGCNYYIERKFNFISNEIETAYITDSIIKGHWVKSTLVTSLPSLPLMTKPTWIRRAFDQQDFQYIDWCIRTAYEKNWKNKCADVLDNNPLFSEDEQPPLRNQEKLKTLNDYMFKYTYTNTNRGYYDDSCEDSKDCIYGEDSDLLDALDGDMSNGWNID